MYTALTKSWSRLRRQLGPFGTLTGLAAVLPPVGGILILGTLDIVGPWLAGHGIWGLLIYIAAFIVFAGLALLPTYSQAVLGGWAFGYWLGFPAALLGFLGASLLAHILARRLAGPGVDEAIAERPKWQAVQRALIGQGFWRTAFLVTLVRLPPVAPFAMTNMVLAGTGVKRMPFLLGTLIGMAPRTAVAVFAAAGVADLRDAEVAEHIYITGIGVTILVLIALTWIGKRAMRAVTAAGEAVPIPEQS